MSPLLDSDNYELQLVGLPFWLAASALGAVFLYALVMRGAPYLRASIIVFTGGLLPYVVAFGLAESTSNDAAAVAFFRFGTAFVPLASTGALVFELSLADRLRSHRVAVAITTVVALAFLVLGLTTDGAVDDVVVTPSGLRFFAAGPLVLPAAGVITIVSLTGFFEALRAARTAVDPVRRRRLWGGLIALAVAFFGLSDVTLAYGVGYVPVSWFFVSLGALLALRSIFLDDLLRARSIDSRTPVAFLGFSLTVVTAWTLAQFVVGPLPPWLAAMILMLSIFGARLTVALVARWWTIRIPGERPLDRLLARFATRVHQLGSVAEIGALTNEVCQIGLGEEVTVIVPAADDWSWQRTDGVALAPEQQPDPLLGPLLTEIGRPLFRADLDGAGLADLHGSVEQLLTAFAARALVPLVVRDELVGLMLLTSNRRRVGVRHREMQFVSGIAGRLAAALDYVRVAADVEKRAELVRDVQLAAAVQAGFVPGPEPSRHHGVTVVGSWQPASECGGDWWSRYSLGGGCTLIVIGDVTGSGVAAAMVTAAARGACDAAVLSRRDDLDLLVLFGQLDQAVRHVGAGRFHLTCFAAVLDPDRGEIRFANAGHVAPYVCRARAEPTASGDTVDLSALVGRGNPLGAGSAPVAKAMVRPLAAGDTVIWYTDGLIECHGADGKQFGDRRLQRILKRLSADEIDPVAVQRRLAAELAAHLGGLPIDDDMTLVVAHVDQDHVAPTAAVGASV